MTPEEEYWKFVESERHFNEVQSNIRNIASGWMLAAFGAIALLMRTDPGVTWLMPPAVLVGVVSMMATLGLLVLWINDQLVYQRLLDCGFIIALKREYDNPQLPPVRSMMMYSAEGKGMSRWMTYFYTIPMWGFFGITLATAILLSAPMEGRVGLAALALVQMAACIWVQKRKSKVGARACSELFGDPKFAHMFEGTEEARGHFAEVIRKSRPAPLRSDELVRTLP